MTLLDTLKDVISQYASGATPSGDPRAHFDQVAESVEPDTLAHGIAAIMRSDDTPPFAQLVSQLFSSGSLVQKTAMVNTLLSSITPQQRAQFASLIPGLASKATVTSDQLSTVSPTDIKTLAERVEQRDAGVVEKMSALYAAHPMLVKTLGSTALAVAMRAIAERQQR